MITEELKPNQDELTTYKGKWRLVWFAHSGESDPGDGVYDSEGAAIKQANEDMIQFEEDNLEISWKGGWILWTLISHAIPMPIGDA